MIEEVKQKLEKDLNKDYDEKSLNELKIKYLSKNGLITKLNGEIKNIDPKDRKEFGMRVNELRNMFNDFYDEKINKITNDKLNEKLESEKIDISLPSTKIKMGAPHILEKLVEEVEEVFLSMGYDVIDGPEVETDKYNFEMLNVFKGHPARDAQDTFYVEGEELLLRSQTSPVQVRTMLEGKGEVPIRMICPGKTYRRDDDDASHSHQFMQIEGLIVDKDISLTDLKGTLTIAFKRLLGSDTEVRFRPSFYPFTEPSVEVDVTCNSCHGKGSGFAFGFGADRLAMMKYGINDIRVFYNADLRESKVFDREDEE